MLEADLAQTYGVDLLDLWRGRLSWRRLHVLVSGLPGTSRIASRDTPEHLRGWAPTDLLLAQVADRLSIGLYEERIRNTDKAHRNKVPEPVLLTPTGKPKAAEVPVVRPRDLHKFLSASPRELARFGGERT